MSGATALRYDFARLTAADLPRIRRWLDAPHVAALWPGADAEIALIAATIESDDVDPFLVSLDGRPIGYLQCYAAEGSDASALAAEAAGTRGIDQFTGEPGLFAGLAQRAHFHERVRDRSDRPDQPDIDRHQPISISTRWL